MDDEERKTNQRTNSSVFRPPSVNNAKVRR
jgi:hypothetical protein